MAKHRHSFSLTTLALAATVVSSVLLAGCGGISKESTDKAKSLDTASSQVILNFWVMPNSLEPVKDIEALIEPFKRAHPNIDVKITSVDWGSAWTKITTAATN